MRGFRHLALVDWVSNFRLGLANVTLVLLGFDLPLVLLGDVSIFVGQAAIEKLILGLVGRHTFVGLSGLGRWHRLHLLVKVVVQELCALSLLGSSLELLHQTLLLWRQVSDRLIIRYVFGRLVEISTFRKECQVLQVQVHIRKSSSHL